MRRGRVQATLQVDLARGGHQQILPAHNMRDALCGIVHHHGELIRPMPIGAQQHKIADVVGEVLRVMPDNFIGKGDGFIGHNDAPCGGFVGIMRQPENAVGATRAVVHKAICAHLRGGVPIFAAAIAGIRQACGFQAAECFAVERVALALVGNCAVPFKAELF